jgi:adenylate cyclase
MSDPHFATLQVSIGVVFVDIHGFTTISEAMAPIDVMRMLQDFHSRMETIALRHGGSLVVSVGDMLLATFGIPTKGSSDATNALACAREMLDKQKEWNLEWTATGYPWIGIGIGAHYGPVASGMMGGEHSKALAVIGDTVNIANRLEGLTRSLEGDLVVSTALIEEVCREANSGRTALGIEDLSPIGARALRGRSERINAYILPR